MTTITNIKHLMHLEEKQKVIRSEADSKSLYSADYDLQEYINKDSSDIHMREHILELFQIKFKKVKKAPNIFMIDFKAGVNSKNNTVLRWDFNEIMQGFKQIDNNIYKFVDIFTMVSTIKLDIIAYIDERFVEFSENYYFKLDKFRTYDEKSEDKIKTSLLLDVKQYVKNDNLYKGLKRFLSYCKLINLDSQVKILESFFNSKSDKIYKLVSDLELIIVVIDETNCSFDKIIIGMSHTEYNLNRYSKPYNSIIESKSKEAVRNKTIKLITRLRISLDKDTRAFIDKNSFLEKFIAL